MNQLKQNHGVVIAMTVARVAHFGQTYGGGSYFEEHLAKVVAEVRARGGDDDAVMVGWLHDVLEDTKVTPEFLLSMGLPEHVVAAVKLMTHDPNDTYEQYVMKIASSGNKLAHLVKVSDITCNKRAGGKPGDSEARTLGRIVKYNRALEKLEA